MTPCSWGDVPRRLGGSPINVLVVKHFCKEHLKFAYVKVDLNFLYHYSQVHADIVPYVAKFCCAHILLKMVAAVLQTHYIVQYRKPAATVSCVL